MFDSSQAFIETRVIATRNVQEQIAADWLWEELSLAGWNAKIADLTACRRLINSTEKKPTTYTAYPLNRKRSRDN